MASARRAVGPGVRRGDDDLGFVIDFVCTRRSSRLSPARARSRCSSVLSLRCRFFPGQQWAFAGVTQWWCATSDPELEAGAAVAFGLAPDAPAMAPHDPSNRGQADPGPLEIIGT